jgi:hypothetical protein
MEKKGKPRSHVGNLEYKREKYGDMNNNLTKMANNMNLEQIEEQVNQDLKVPDDMMGNIERLLNDPNSRSEKMKTEMDLRGDQIKLRKMLKVLSDHLTTVLT